MKKKKIDSLAEAQANDCKPNAAVYDTITKVDEGRRIFDIGTPDTLCAADLFVRQIIAQFQTESL